MKHTNSVTPEMVESLIIGVKYTRVSEKTTVCVLTLSNGMETVGFSIRQNSVEHNEELANKSAYGNAKINTLPIAIAHYYSCWDNSIMELDDENISII